MHEARLDASKFLRPYLPLPAAAAISTRHVPVVKGGHVMTTILLRVVPKLILLAMLYVSPACGR